MTFRFRRRIRILPGVRLNASKSRLSTSAGQRGARVTTISFLIVIATPFAVLALVYAGLFIRSMQRHFTLEHLIVLSLVWQTLIGATFAIFAAVIGAAVVLNQTAATRNLEAIRRQRRASALRAVLPLALANLADYAAHCAKIQANTLLAQTNGGPVEFPELPVGLVDQLMGMIEASEPDHARPLILLVRRVQIQHSRVRELQRRASGQHRTAHIVLKGELINGVIDAAEIHARCAALAIYARGETDAAASPITPCDVKSSLFVMLITLPDLDELHAKIDHRAAVYEEGGSWPEV